MPAKSKSQQRFFGVVKGIQKGTGKGTGKAKKAAKDMSASDVDDFASTKHKGLPNKVKRESRVRSLIRKMVREIMKEDFAGSLKQEDRKEFDNTRKKQSEVLGYKLTGTPDVKTEIDDATVKEGKLSKSQIKKMRDKFDKTGKLPPHLQKLADLMDKHKGVKDIVVPGLEWMADIKEAKKRDYKAEYKKYGSSKKAKKYRAELNAYNRKKGTYGNGDGKDASHKGGKIAGFEKESVNRGRAEKSRLKKEGKLNEVNKKHFLKLIHDELKSIIGQKKYVKKALSKKNLENWERKEFNAIWPGLVKREKELMKHQRNVAVMKEGKLTEDYKNNKWEVYVADEKGKEKIVKVAKSKRAGVILYNKLINTDKYHEVGMRVIKEGKLTEASNDTFINILTKFGFTKGTRDWGGHHFFVHKGKKLYATYHPTGRSIVIEPKRGGKPVFDSARSNFSIKALLNYLQSPSNKFVSTEGKLTEAEIWFNPKVLEPYLKKIGLKFPKYPKQGDVLYKGKKVGHMSNFNGFQVYSKSLLKQLQKVERKYKLGIWNPTSGLTMEGKLTEGKRRELEIHVMDKLKVDKILKKLRLKSGKDYDIGYGSSRSFVLDIDVKHLDKIVALLRSVRVRVKEEKLSEVSGVEKVLAMADGGYGKLGGKLVDGMSANLFKAVYEKANDKTKEKINKMNEKQLYVFMTKLWSKFGRQVKI